MFDKHVIRRSVVVAAAVIPLTVAAATSRAMQPQSIAEDGSSAAATLTTDASKPVPGTMGGTVWRSQAVVPENNTALLRKTVPHDASSDSEGGLPHVAIIASAAVNEFDPWFTDPRDKLMATSRFASVTIINAGTTTPILDDLLDFDAVVVWSNLDFADESGFGDVLADYIDAGGGVVVALFANTSTNANRRIAGRWLTHEYEIVPSAGGTTSGSAGLGLIFEPAHPLASTVAVFSGGTSSFRPTTTAVVPEARVIAEWSDGKTLVAVRDDAVGARVDLGFYPPSDQVLGGFWDADTDGAILLANALHFAATRTPLAPGDTDLDTDVDLVDFAKFQICFTAEGDVTVPAGCVTFDFDRDDDVDLSDLNAYLQVVTGPQ